MSVRKTKGIFVTGTDTGVGKTIVSACLLWKLREKGIKAGYFKPVQTGAENGIPSDAEFCKKILGLEEPYEALCGYILKLPASPHLAGSVEGIEIKPEVILEKFNQLLQKYEFLVVEGAGGLLVPINLKGYYIRELAKDLGLPLIITARAKLGTINHTLLTIESAKRAGLKILGVILTPFPKKASIIEKDNAEVIEKLGEVKVIGKLPEIPLNKEGIKKGASFIDIEKCGLT